MAGGGGGGCCQGERGWTVSYYRVDGCIINGVFVREVPMMVLGVARSDF